MTRLKTVIADLKQTTVAQVIRQVSAIAAVLGALWLFMGPMVESYADEAFVKMMTKQGVSPKAFEDITKKVGEIDKKTDALTNDLDAVKKQGETVLRAQENLKSQTEETKRLVERLLDFQLKDNN